MALGIAGVAARRAARRAIRRAIRRWCLWRPTLATRLACFQALGVGLALTAALAAGVLARNLEAERLADLRTEATILARALGLVPGLGLVPVPSADANSTDAQLQARLDALAEGRARLVPRRLVSVPGLVPVPFGSTPDGGLFAVAAIPGRQGLAVRMEVSAQSNAKFRAQARWDLAQAMAIGALAALVLGWLLARSLARPLRRLEALAQAARDDPKALRGFDASGVAAAGAGGREIAALAAALRTMATSAVARMEALDRFASDLTHEIKAPLSAVALAAQAFIPADANSRARLARAMASAAARAAAIAEGVARMARLEADSGWLRATPTPLEILLRQALAKAREIEPETTAAVVLELEDSLTPVGPQAPLVVAFSTAIANALAFARTRVRITARREHDQARREHDNVCVVIDDDGPGPPRDLAGALTPFHSDRPEGHGSHAGLGLAIAQRVAARCSGTTRLAHHPEGEGARFVFTLPAARPCRQRVKKNALAGRGRLAGHGRKGAWWRHES